MFDRQAFAEEARETIDRHGAIRCSVLRGHPTHTTWKSTVSPKRDKHRGMQSSEEEVVDAALQTHQRGRHPARDPHHIHPSSLAVRSRGAATLAVLRPLRHPACGLPPCSVAHWHLLRIKGCQRRRHRFRLRRVQTTQGVGPVVEDARDVHAPPGRPCCPRARAHGRSPWTRPTPTT